MHTRVSIRIESRKTSYPSTIIRCDRNRSLPPALTAIPPIRYVDAESATKMLEQTLRHAPKAPMLPDPLPPEPDTPKAFYMGLRGQIEKAEELTYSEQFRILNEVKQGIQEQSSESSARALLEKLDQRPDLFVAIADEISVLKTTEFRDFRYLQVVPVESPPEVSESTLPTPVLVEPEHTIVGPAPQAPTQKQSAIKEPKETHHLRNAAIGAIIGEVLRHVLDLEGFNPLGIAGAITGLLASGNPRVVLIAIMTSALAVGIDYSSNYPTTNPTTASLGLVLGAIAAYIFLRPSKPKS